MEISHSIYLSGISRFDCLKSTVRLYLSAIAGTMWKVTELFMIELILKGTAVVIWILDLESAVGNRGLCD